MMRLNIGGTTAKQDWKILNIQSADYVDYVGDISDLSQFADESVEEVYASHVLEHVPQAKILPTLKGINRILKPSGRFYVSVPDIDILSRVIIDPRFNPQQKFHAVIMMFGGQIDQHDFHFFGWNEMFMRDFLAQAGFATAERVKSFGLFDDTSDYSPFGFPISLNMEVRKLKS